MKNIVPHFWFDREAKEAAEFYVSLFENSGIVSTSVIRDTPSGDAEVVEFNLAGQPFQAISAGQEFKINPSISLMVSCDSQAEVDALWEALFQGGSALMPLDEYPFSGRYGWLQDRYGLNWQLMLTDGRHSAQKISPNLLFSNQVCGLAEEGVRFYTGVFPDSKAGLISRYQEGEASVQAAKVNYAGFSLKGMELSAMDNGYEADFNFNEAFSFIIPCENQQEIDYFWDRLSAVPEAEACGWLKDRFGVSWQVVPANLKEMMDANSEEAVRRVTQAFLAMKKMDMAALKAAFEGR